MVERALLLAASLTVLFTAGCDGSGESVFDASAVDDGTSVGTKGDAAGGGSLDGGRGTDAGVITLHGNDGSSKGSADACAPNLTGRLRDFVNKPGATPASALDNDFENESGDDRGIVETDLGSDLKPVYAHGNSDTATTHGQTQFNWWYRDTPGKNIPYNYAIALTLADGGAPGVRTFNNQEFFPLDGRGWDDEYTGDDGKQHNFSFTFELHTTFGFKGGETFTFTGDDDVFVFINQKLVVDLGGVHTAETKSIALDTLVTDDVAKSKVPLTVGQTYPLDIFYNERHTVSSHFRMDTSIGFNNCTAIIAPK